MTETYLNPAFQHDFADPFVLRHQGEFWAYCTGIHADGRCFGIARSLDLVEWQFIGSAMDPLPGGHTCYWAPEVSYLNGRFYLYYSVGNEELMQIRVATASHPTGPFEDSGHRLTDAPFAIDPHVFEDRDGQRYLFYATDFLARERIGTGTVVDRMLDPFTLQGDPRPVTLPRYDWQIYDPARAEKGGVRWHTIEGSFVLHHKARYYQMFSGGNWQNPSYGVSYATTDNLSRGAEWRQASDGEGILPLLRSIAGRVIGPGHNSVVRGPDNRQLFCVYHRWSADHTRREMAIDRLEWVGERLDVLGPTHSPQHLPLAPTFSDRFDTPRDSGLGAGWTWDGGRWHCEDGAARQTDHAGHATARCGISAPSFRAEVSAWALANGTADGAFGVMLLGDDGEALQVGVQPGSNCLAIRWRSEGRTHSQRLSLPGSFDATAPHLFRLDVDGGRVQVALDGDWIDWSGVIRPGSYNLALFTERMPAAFGHVGLTEGWEERWEGDHPVIERGWETRGTRQAWRVEALQLRYTPMEGGAPLRRGPALSEYELVINVRGTDDGRAGPAYALLPALDDGGAGPALVVAREGDTWGLVWKDERGEQRFSLPDDFAPANFQHFRIRKEAGRLTLFCGTAFVGAGEVGSHATRVGVAGFDQPLTFDLMRVTAITLLGDTA